MKCGPKGIVAKVVYTLPGRNRGKYSTLESAIKGAADLVAISIYGTYHKRARVYNQKYIDESNAYIRKLRERAHRRIKRLYGFA